MIKFIQPDFEFKDDRGCLTQLVSDGWKQVNVIFSKGNQIRGNHYHKINKEAFYIISGSLKLTLTCNGVQEEYHIKEKDFFVIEKNINHSFEFIEDTTLVSMYDQGVVLDNDTKDIYTNE